MRIYATTALVFARLLGLLSILSYPIWVNLFLFSCLICLYHVVLLKDDCWRQHYKQRPDLNWTTVTLSLRRIFALKTAQVIRKITSQDKICTAIFLSLSKYCRNEDKAKLYYTEKKKQREIDRVTGYIDLIK